MCAIMSCVQCVCAHFVCAIMLGGNRSEGNRECRQTELSAKICAQTKQLAIGNVG